MEAAVRVEQYDPVTAFRDLAVALAQFGAGQPARALDGVCPDIAPRAVIPLGEEFQAAFLFESQEGQFLRREG